MDNTNQTVEVGTSPLTAEQIKGLAPEIAAANNGRSYLPKPQLAMPVVYSHPGAKGGGAPYACAAIITAVAVDATLTIFTFPPNMSGESFSGVKYGDGVGQCSFPRWI